MHRLVFLISRFCFAIGFVIATMPCLCEAMVERTDQAVSCHSSHCDHDADHDGCGHCGHSIHDCMNQKAEAIHWGFSAPMKVVSKIAFAQITRSLIVFSGSVVPFSSPPQSPPSISILRI